MFGQILSGQGGKKPPPPHTHIHSKTNKWKNQTKKNPNPPHCTGHLETFLSITFLKFLKEHCMLFWFPILKIIQYRKVRMLRIWNASIKGITSRLGSSSLKRDAECKLFWKSIQSVWERYEVHASQGKAGKNSHMLCNWSVGIIWHGTVG